MNRKKNVNPLLSSPKKRINTVKKGQRSQQKCKKFYEKEGYKVEVVRRDRWKKDNDFFGLFDLICISKMDVRLVQVKTNGNVSREWKEKVKQFYHPKLCVIEICIYVDYRRGVVPANRITLGPEDSNG